MGFKIDESLLIETEARLARRLPQSLRTRLLANNGGDVDIAGDDWILFPVRDSSDRKRLARSANNIETETRSAIGWPRFPAGAFAIGSNGSGNLLVILPGSEAIWLWDHETGQTAEVLGESDRFSD